MRYVPFCRQPWLLGMKPNTSPFLEQLDITLKDFSLPKQRQLHKLLEKHLLVFTISPEGYGFTVALGHILYA